LVGYDCPGRPNRHHAHIAIQGRIDGRAVDWLERVSDARYRR
jgi:hypothetical protein